MGKLRVDWFGGRFQAAWSWGFRGRAWFRVYGYGLSVRNVDGEGGAELLFRDRNLLGKCVRIETDRAAVILRVLEP